MEYLKTVQFRWCWPGRPAPGLLGFGRGPVRARAGTGLDATPRQEQPLRKGAFLSGRALPDRLRSSELSS